MVIHIDIHRDRLPEMKQSIACIGYFDGVHRGHQQLIQTAVENSLSAHTEASVICFEPDPIQIITAEIPSHILSYAQRIGKLQEYGIKDIIVFSFDDDLMRMDAKDFVNDYLNRMELQQLICGFDFTFGSLGKGDPGLLKTYGNFETVVIPEYRFEGEKVSATRIKEALFRGDFSLAEALLGYAYYTDMNVTDCSRNGLKWLIEAIPADPYVVIPQDGIYQGMEIKENRIYFENSTSWNIGDQIKIRYRDYERTV